MELIKHTTDWATGDALQGRIMLAAGVLLGMAAIAILRTDNALLKGMLIPTALVVTACLGYGGFLAFTRSGHLQQTAQRYAENPRQAIAREYDKAARDHKTYSVVKKVWPVLIVLAALMHLFVRTEYLKGLSIGLVGLFLFGLILDTFLHQRLEPYLEVLDKLRT